MQTQRGFSSLLLLLLAAAILIGGGYVLMKHKENGSPQQLVESSLGSVSTSTQSSVATSSSKEPTKKSVGEPSVELFVYNLPYIDMCYKNIPQNAGLQVIKVEEGYESGIWNTEVGDLTDKRSDGALCGRITTHDVFENPGTYAFEVYTRDAEGREHRIARSSNYFMVGMHGIGVNGIEQYLSEPLKDSYWDGRSFVVADSATVKSSTFKLPQERNDYNLYLGPTETNNNGGQDSTIIAVEKSSGVAIVLLNFSAITFKGGTSQDVYQFLLDYKIEPLRI